MQLDMLQTVNEYNDPGDIRVLLGCEKSGVAVSYTHLTLPTKA